MRNFAILSIQEIMQAFVSQPQYQDKLLGASIVNAWYHTMPIAVIQQTQQIYVQNHKLFIKINSAVLKNELFIKKHHIIQRLKTALQQGISPAEIQEIIFL